MKLKEICLIIIAVLIVVIGFLVIKNLYNNPNNAIIIQYDEAGFEEMKKIKLNSDDVNKIKKEEDKFEEEKIDLELIKDVEIIYDNIIITIQLDEKDYCYYENQEKNISYISKMPEGLYELVEEKIK